MRLRVSPRAERDLDEHFLWYEFQRAGLGEDFFASVTVVFRAIQTGPSIYPLARRKVRRAPMLRFPYGVFYTVSVDEVVILAIVHNRRHPRAWPGRAGP